jgi:hypothetical protein
LWFCVDWWRLIGDQASEQKQMLHRFTDRLLTRCESAAAAAAYAMPSAERPATGLADVLPALGRYLRWYIEEADTDNAIRQDITSRPKSPGRPPVSKKVPGNSKPKRGACSGREQDERAITARATASADIAIRLAHPGVDQPDNLTGRVGHRNSRPRPPQQSEFFLHPRRGMWARAAARN